MCFYQPPGPSFKITVDEVAAIARVAHLTTAATCIESLQACPPDLQPSGAPDVREIAKRFAAAAIIHPEWKSDGSAEIYCRCRALPCVFETLDVSNFKTHEATVSEHLTKIWSQVKGGRFAIGEVAETEPYPPNCFHTYWALRTDSIVRRRIPDFWPEGMSKIAESIPAAIMWTRQVLGWQVALHQAGSSHRDSDQLAWAISTLLEFSHPPFLAYDMDAISIGLKCLFSTQADYGGWPRFEPLFHYAKAGNAYCYTYETFAILLRCSLLPGREFFRRLLYDYRQQLLRMLDYAERTQVALRQEPGQVGWCSGHHPNRPKPEGWATASVFACAQELRRLFGIWTREAAEADLGVQAPGMGETQALVEIEQGQAPAWV